MADLKSMLLLYEYEDVFAELESDEERGQLIMAMYAYDRRGEEPDFTGVLKFAWRTHIKPKMDEMKAKYDTKCKRLRENAKKRWEKHNDAIAENDMQTDAIGSYKDKDKDKDKDKYHPSVNNYSDNTNRQPVDNSVGNAEPEANKQQPATLDGMDLYLLDNKNAFELFRKEYPRHQGALRDAQTAWVMTTVENHVLPGDLVMAARNYAAKCKREKVEEKFIKMPHTFLRDGWKEFIPQYLPSCPHCHGQGVYEDGDRMIMCDCDRRYG
jgi:hypothetical protein